MSKKQHPKRHSQQKKTQDSVFQEAWQNMNNDMSRVMPAFLSKRLADRKGKLWLMVVVSLVELVILGFVGKFIYEWFAGL